MWGRFVNVGTVDGESTGAAARCFAQHSASSRLSNSSKLTIASQFRFEGQGWQLSTCAATNSGRWQLLPGHGVRVYTYTVCINASLLGDLWKCLRASVDFVSESAAELTTETRAPAPFCCANEHTTRVCISRPGRGIITGHVLLEVTRDAASGTKISRLPWLGLQRNEVMHRSQPALPGGDSPPQVKAQCAAKHPNLSAPSHITSLHTVEASTWSLCARSNAACLPPSAAPASSSSIDINLSDWESAPTRRWPRHLWGLIPARSAPCPPGAAPHMLAQRRALAGAPRQHGESIV